MECNFSEHKKSNCIAKLDGQKKVATQKKKQKQEVMSRKKGMLSQGSGGMVDLRLLAVIGARLGVRAISI